jgi:pyrroloquinoline quinone (PQQ) biosynthesis protein C
VGTFSDQIFELLGDLSARQERTFFQKLIAGELSRASLQEYYRHLYHECCAFVRLVSAVHVLAEEKDQREALGHNLVDEYGHGEAGMDHPSLAIRVGCAVGLTEDEILRHGLYPELQAELDRVKALAQSSFLEGLAALVAIEADLPLRHKLMHEALTKRYGVNAKELRYYAEHMDGSDLAKAGGTYGGDDVHVGREVALIEKYATTPAEQARVLDAIRATFQMRNALARVLERRCARAGGA